LKRNLTLAALTFFALLLSGCSKSGPNQTTQPAASPTAAPVKIASVNVVKANPEEVTIRPGGSAETSIRMTIDKGYHVNANPPTFPYLKPTELVFKPAPPTSVDLIIYPTATTRKFQFAEKPLAVYEGEIVIKVQLKVEKGAPKGKQNFSGKLRVQACDEEVCYPPGERDIVIPVNIQ